MLSAQASPFVPLSFEPVVIFNDGVPAMVAQDEHEVLHNIPDEAIDEAFPPTAEEAAELEEAEHYVNLMARLALMEEREEAARNDHIGLAKRWEARRELVGRPRQAKHLVSHVEHGKRCSLHEDLGQDLVIHDQSRIDIEHRLRARQNAGNGKAAYKQHHGHHATQRKNSRPIQQPRKQS
mmetsp:Transcript_20099/g.57009  ORF Transcript_20099/g.57009 Transcript_20099/m.57009 type:complete len:180 (+) Transcript_20099:279-818(+)|eukprot:CAMPEP_0119553170 /NCGR_PEP_ID=MMETSP1352-20130426/5982_1 /TAXON_ID=265584 /ORGANISM="Stauroneis constricta, Strain CCMP1120" /LENGTH=179 /DNA_ID=CAMNT_0007599525 /DNA_START=199 /DNA_END=738 /DNA_ORIENTATION=-